jgi:hypothetical protein
MKNSLALVVGIVAVILGVLAYIQSRALHQQQEQAQQLSTKLDSATKFSILALQQQCADQAQKYLAQFDNSHIKDAQNHYNAQLNKCFVKTTDVLFEFGRSSTATYVADAYEGKYYASYMDISASPSDPTSKESLQSCRITPPDGQEVDCHSSGEFDSLIKQYMESK